MEDKYLTIKSWFHGLTAAIPDFGCKLFVELEIIAPMEKVDHEHPVSPPIEFRCVEIVGDSQDRLQRRVYTLSHSDGKIVSTHEFMQELHTNFPWLRGLVIPAIKIRFSREGGLPTIDLSIEPRNTEGAFTLAGTYGLVLAECGPKYQEDEKAA